MFTRVLIANRGEIAVRVIRACRELGIESVAVYSDADEHALHVRLADRAVAIGAAPASDSYLVVDRLIDAARATRADAIHPGYGFLAENATLAHACADSDIAFVGPPATAIEQMGSKIGARQLMQSANVPTVPGETPADQSDAGIRAAATAIGYPLLVKASAGGGGKGMRRVDEARGLDDAIGAARREAEAAFGDATLYVERRLVRPRHIEIQVVGDRDGRYVHLFERDCSVQRRHQKIIEESPSPAIGSRVRDAMGTTAIAAARAVAYENAGTVEFLVEGEGDDARFYFLEMNTRLQVEHPVTEAVVGVDLVAAQLAIAAGHPLPWDQAGLAQRGHAIECRVYAEDSREMLPQAGRILAYREPTGPGIRVDSGVAEGSMVSVHYDPLLSKVIAWADTRRAAIARATAALQDYPILGIETNVSFLLQVLEHPRFQDGSIDTGFVDRERDSLAPAEDNDLLAVALAAACSAEPVSVSQRRDRTATQTDWDPWVTLEGWRG